MLRFIAFLWNGVDPAQAQDAQLLTRRLLQGSPEWHTALSRDGLMVFVTGARPGSGEPYVLHGQAGVVLGTLFERKWDEDSTPRKAVLGPTQTVRIVATGGRELIESYWGRYVAFLYDAAQSRKWILRDPTGGLPCLRTAFRGIEICFSFMDDCARIEPLSFSINWRYIAAHVVASRLQTTETALNEVSELAAGECLEIQGNRVSSSFYWHPFRVADSGVIEDPEQATAALRLTTTGCVHAYTSCHSSILHRLSGGLDSAIVLSCLRSAPTRPQVICLNEYSRGSDTDERVFARVAARSTGYAVIERERNPAVRLDGILELPKAAVPTFYLGCVQDRQADVQLARKVGATAFFNGRGGDQLFYQSRATLAAADYAHRHGIRPPLFKIALDAACLESASKMTSIWTVLASAWRYGLFKYRWDPAQPKGKYRALVDPQVVEAAERDDCFRHPWFKSACSVAPGKFLQAHQLAFHEAFYDLTGQLNDPESVQPLMSQPLMELCLRIPNYVHTIGGRDRAIARRAFAAEVPREILARSTKGGIIEHVRQVLQANICFVRELLLDGILVKERLLDRRKVEETLGDGPTPVIADVDEIFDHVSTEAWLKIWSDAGNPPRVNSSASMASI